MNPAARWLEKGKQRDSSVENNLKPAALLCMPGLLKAAGAIVKPLVCFYVSSRREWSTGVYLPSAQRVDKHTYTRSSSSSGVCIMASA
jgi:hypothetical protein